MKKQLLNFKNHLLSKEQMKKVNGGKEEECLPAGTRVFVEDSDHCLIFEYGFNPECADDCYGWVVDVWHQPCAFA